MYHKTRSIGRRPLPKTSKPYTAIIWDHYAGESELIHFYSSGTYPERDRKAQRLYIEKCYLPENATEKLQELERGESQTYVMYLFSGHLAEVPYGMDQTKHMLFQAAENVRICQAPT